MQLGDCLDGMAEYIKYLKALPLSEARQVARESLIQSGVLDENGDPHDIVNR